MYTVYNSVTKSILWLWIYQGHLSPSECPASSVRWKVVVTTDASLIARWHSVLSGSARKSDVSTSDPERSVFLPLTVHIHPPSALIQTVVVCLLVCMLVCVCECRGVLKEHGPTVFMVDSRNGSRMLLQFVCAHLQDYTASQTKGLYRGICHTVFTVRCFVRVPGILSTPICTGNSF
jgi:hypothetical protein